MGISSKPLWLSREEIAPTVVREQIALMLEELGNPPLVNVIFPDGWESAPYEKQCQLYDLCLRTHAQRTAERAAARA